MKFPKGRLLIFAKAPVAGKVKTRLTPAVSAEQAAKLQELFIQNTLQKATHKPLAPVELLCAPDTYHLCFQQCAEQFPITLHTQSGNDLGQRMKKAFQDTLEDADWAIIIGTDCPELTSNDLELAMRELDGGNEAVIQPAYDGGYVLIGLRQNIPRLFSGVDWGTSHVFEQTQDRLNSSGLNYKVFDLKRDIDRPEDLQQLKELNIDFLW